MQLAQRRVVDAVELVGYVQLGDGGLNGVHGDGVSAVEWGGIGKAGVVDVVGWAPGVVDPVGADLEDVVGVVEIVINDKSLFAGDAGEFAIALEVPGVIASEVE